MSGSPYTGECLDQGGLTMIDMAYGADIYLRLALKSMNLNSPL